jgi:hypothetical protein
VIGLEGYRKACGNRKRSFEVGCYYGKRTI